MGPVAPQWAAATHTSKGIDQAFTHAFHGVLRQGVATQIKGNNVTVMTNICLTRVQVMAFWSKAQRVVLFKVSPA